MIIPSCCKASVVPKVSLQSKRLHREYRVFNRVSITASR
jgi:hypothetical protein